VAYREKKLAPLWEDLDESRKESSRDQARDIAAKLRSIKCAISPLRDWDAQDFTFEKWEVEKLAIDEHNRWWEERRRQRWVLIPMPVGKDDKDTKRLLEEAKLRKESPYMISWEALLKRYPDIAEYDRIFVREIPQLLAGVGLQVIQTDPATTASPAPQAVRLRPNQLRRPSPLPHRLFVIENEFTIGESNRHPLGLRLGDESQE
jgi:hypothetical protein